jgi:tetratricopeptide (TPR) repeat protein
MMEAKLGHRFLHLALALVMAGAGCAGALRAGSAPNLSSTGEGGWHALREGKNRVAEESFDRALASNPADVRALFGLATLAYERGDDGAALKHSLALLEHASKSADRVALALAPAIVSRISRLLTEVPDRRPAEERLIALDGRRLPWQARYALGLVLIDIARKRGDAPLLSKSVAATGCVPNMTMVGRGGRLPYLDFLDNKVVADKQPRPLVQAPCQFQLNTVDNRGGIRVLRSEVELPAGRYHVVLDFSGLARLRVDQGDWHQHGDPESYGPRWSATTAELSGGRHSLEIRIGIQGATADLALMVMPAADADDFRSDEATGGDQAMLTLALALSAGLVGDTNALLPRIDSLQAWTHFSIALPAAARLGQSDLTRPLDIMRDRGRALLFRAVAIDPSLARAWTDLSNLEIQKGLPREAATEAQKAVNASPGWWPAHLALATALRAEGFDRPADLALDAGMALLKGGNGGCSLIEAALARAQDREKEATAARLVELASRCDAQSDSMRLWLQRHGDSAGSKAWLDKNLPLTAEPLWLRSERANLLLACGDVRATQEALASLIDDAPRDTGVRIRLADAQNGAGAAEQARQGLAKTLAEFPGRQDVQDAARLAGLPLPLDAYRLDGKAVIRDYRASGRKYQSPAVVVLDRAVEKVLPDGGRIVLTHSITQVLSKDAVEHVGEAQVPDGAEVLALRTHKADGTVREAEEIAGKSTISAPNLAVGDFVESETLEYKPPRDAIAPGFIGERFYFQSFDAPLDRSEYVVIVPAADRVQVSTRADAPPSVETRAADGSRVLTFATRAAPQAFPERSAVPAQEWMPSVRVSGGLSILGWSRFIADGFTRVSRISPEIRKVAAEIGSHAPASRTQLPEAIVSWVREHIEPEADFAESATATLARGRGNRTALILALARSLGVPADLVLARSLLVAKADSQVAPEDLDDFRDPLVRFPDPHGDRFVDPQLRRAPFAYLPPALNGAKAIVAGDSATVSTVSGVKNGRNVKLRAELQPDGGAKVDVVEDLSGWPAVEWYELLDHMGKDRQKLRQEFEQRWLGQQFPGAQLDTLSVDTADGAAKVSYSFTLSGMARRQGSVLELRPSFFQSQPGRRFGTEPQRKTALMLGFDIPVDLDAEIVLPAGAKVLDVGRSNSVSVGDATFAEARSSVSLPDGRSKLVLRRNSRLPLMRVEPSEYADIAAKLRAVDPVEQGEVRIGLPKQ